MKWIDKRGWARALDLIAIGTCVTLVKTVLPLPAVATASWSAQDRADRSEFAFDLYRTIVAEEAAADEAGNIVISPLSISLSSSVLWAGARGQTADEITSVLRFVGPADEFHRGFSDLLRRLSAQVDGHGELSFATGIWFDDTCPVVETYEVSMREHYDAEIGALDLSQAGIATDTINSWVAQATRGKIAGTVGPEMFNDATRAVSVSTIYLNAQWEHAFPERRTELQPFRRPGLAPVDVSTMRSTESYAYGENKVAQVLQLRCRSNGLAMMLVLPKGERTLSDIETALDVPMVADWVNTLKERRVDVWLPKFEIKSHYDLIPLMRALGTSQVFGLDADLGGLCTAKPNFVNVMLHDAVIQVDEKGIEAAAATSWGTTKGLIEPWENPVVFRADHPFLYLVRDTVSGTILFMGRVTDPR